MLRIEKTVAIEEFNSVTELPEDEQALVAAAWEARRTAYMPYSGFRVGGAVATRDGRIIRGSNQENRNYRASCAETVACNTTSVEGLRDQIAKVAVVGLDDDCDLSEIPVEPEIPVTPCGQCCQDLLEIEDVTGPLVVIMASRNRVRRVYGVENFLPFGFKWKKKG